jgi:hypothetical protein
MVAAPRYIAPARTEQETPLPTVTPLLRVTLPLPNDSRLSGSTSEMYHNIQGVAKGALQL